MIALALGGRTVAEWQRVMTRVEYEGWIDYYGRHPFSDRFRYHRPAALTAFSLGRDMEEVLDWLTKGPAQIKAEAAYSEADMNTFAAFGVKPPVRR